MSLRATAVTAVIGLCVVNLCTGLALSGQVKKVKTFEACVASLKTPFLAGADPKACPPVIVTEHLVAARSYACDAALTARPENTYGVQAACTTPVKTLQAERDVARREASRLSADLTRERLERDDVVARARAAATTQAERIARAAAALKAAPRDGDGLVVCDADCVRARWTADAAARP